MFFSLFRSNALHHSYTPYIALGDRRGNSSVIGPFGVTANAWGFWLVYNEATYIAVIARDCHGYEKPAGKCHRLLWGTGPGCQVCTLRKPVPVPRVDGF